MEAAKDLVQTVTVPEAQFLFEQVLDRSVAVNPAINPQRVADAYDYALRAHYGKYRDLGEPYILHPVEVMEICAQLNMDEDSLVTALLHDVEEDTTFTLKDIERAFGRDVRSMVDSLTKISDANFFVRLWNRKETKKQEETLRKLFIAMAKDPRVIVIKLADRLHNLRTLEGLPKKKITRKCKETQDFFIPLARRLGLSSLYREMEDWCFYYLNPKECKELGERVMAPMAEAEEILREMQEELENAFWQAAIPISEIHSRKKHLASIYSKITEKEIRIDEIYDLLAMRVVVEGPARVCYQVLGEIHLKYPPIMHRFRDFIASPKTNGYQTLHTTVVGPRGRFVEIQIRNLEMHRRAQFGIASHWMYKENPSDYNYREDEEWVEIIKMLEDEHYDSQEFIARAQAALLKDVVLTLTPKGEVVSLPKGSTPIDFAYAIHTDLGHATGGAKVNGHRAPLYQRLENGDVIEVIKRESGHPAPDPEWLEWVKSPRTVLKIRKWFRAQPKKKRIEIGRDLLHKQIQRRGLYPLNLLAADKLVSILRLLKVGSIHDIYDRIALGDLTTTEVLHHLKQVQMERAIKMESEAMLEQFPLEASLVASGIELRVLDTRGKRTRQKAELSGCCRPIPGDEISGFFDRTKRMIIVHRSGCPSLAELPAGTQREPLSWESGLEDMHYPAAVEIISLNRAGLMYEVLGILASEQINLVGGHFETAFSTSAEFDKAVKLQMLIEVANTGELVKALDQIRTIPDVIIARRVEKSPKPDSGDGTETPVGAPHKSVSKEIEKIAIEDGD